MTGWVQGGERTWRWRITNAAFSRARHDKVTEDVQTSRDGQEAGERGRSRMQLEFPFNFTSEIRRSSQNSRVHYYYVPNTNN